MYTEEEFIRTAILRGYARESIAKMWCKQNHKALYEDEDLIELYRFAEREPPEIIKLICYDEEDTFTCQKYGF